MKPGGSESEVVVVKVGIQRLDDLQPVWASLHEHHVEVAPHLRALGVVRTSSASWEARRNV